jgi:hypothetical protein
MSQPVLYELIVKPAHRPVRGAMPASTPAQGQEPASTSVA